MLSYIHTQTSNTMTIFVTSDHNMDYVSSARTVCALDDAIIELLQDDVIEDVKPELSGDDWADAMMMVFSRISSTDTVHNRLTSSSIQSTLLLFFRFQSFDQLSFCYRPSLQCGEVLAPIRSSTLLTTLYVISSLVMFACHLLTVVPTRTMFVSVTSSSCLLTILSATVLGQHLLQSG